MGNSNTCQNNQLGINKICKLYKCTEKVSGLKSNSASPTDIWFVTLKNNTRYGEKDISKDVVLKIYLPPDTNFSLGYYNKLVGSIEVKYESEVYENVVGQMLTHLINPHFVKFYGTADKCSFYNMVSILQKNGTRFPKQDGSCDDGSVSGSWNSKKSLIRNTLYMGLNGQNRPSIQTIGWGNIYKNLGSDIIPPYSNPNVILENLYKEIYRKLICKSGSNENKSSLKYNLIVTERIKNSVTLSDWLNKRISYRNINEINKPEIQLMITDVISGIVALNNFKCSHNDLHHGNILVVPWNKTKEKQITTYKFDNPHKTRTNKVDPVLVYQTKSRYHPLIYDWDRAYVQSLGPNPLLTKAPDLCYYGANCNEFVPSRDILKFLGSIFVDFIYKYKIDIRNSKIYYRLFVNNEGADYYYDNVLLQGYKFPPPATAFTKAFFLQNSKYNSVLSAAWINKNVLTPVQILYNYLKLFKDNEFIKGPFDESYASKNSKQKELGKIYNFTSSKGTFLSQKEKEKISTKQGVQLGDMDISYQLSPDNKSKIKRKTRKTKVGRPKGSKTKRK
jgi:hypothetical protein